jgi:hypothetical protein
VKYLDIIWQYNEIMKSQAVRLIIWGQVCLYLGLLVAVVLKPAGLTANSGISYYGIFAKTFVPFEISLLGGATFTWLCALQITDANLRPIRDSLFVMAILTCTVAVTPYALDNLMNAMHRLAGTLLFSLQLILSCWLIAKLHHALWAMLLTAAQLVAGIACALYLYPTHGYLIQSQVLFQFFFSVLLIYSLRQPQLGRVTNAHLI